MKFFNPFKLFKPIKPEVYKVGDWLIITDEIKKCGEFKKGDDVENKIGTRFQVYGVFDTMYGVAYHYAGSDRSYVFPHYAVKKTNQPKLKKEKVTLELTDKQLEKIKKIISI